LEDEDILSKSWKTGTSKKRSHNKAEDAGQTLSPPSTPCPNLGKEWKKAKLKTEDLLTLVNSRFLCQKEMDLWCITAGDPYLMDKNPYEIKMFTRFVECGLALPVSEFFK
jgi:hypothetical protein